MNKIEKTFSKYIGKIVNRFTSVTAQSTGGAGEEFEISGRIKELCRQAAAEGAVLLKNENGALPVLENETLSLFGRVQRDYFYVGYGSGGDVNAPYRIDPVSGLRNAGVKLNEELIQKYKELCEKDPVNDGYWGHWPMSYDEVIIDEETVKTAAAKSDKAAVFIGRSSGEDRELKREKGSYYLSDREKELLSLVTAHFDKVILLLNCGSIMDMQEINAYGSKISAVMYIWQSGMESGNALGDLISGRVSPCGKLADTIADCYESWPGSENFGGKTENVYTEDIYVGYRYFETFAKDKVLYPFGFGLSYTDFDINVKDFSADGSRIELTAEIKNKGSYPGRECLQVYCEKPQGTMGNPSRVLVDYAKTELLAPGETGNITVGFGTDELCSYDELRSAWVLLKGEYSFYAGSDVRNAVLCGKFTAEEDLIIKQVSQCGAPVKPFKRLVNRDGSAIYEFTAVSRKNLRQHILDNLPEPLPYTGNKNITLEDVKSGRNTLDEFVSQLDNTELEAISRGDYKMNSPLGAPGNAGVLAGVTQSLREKGVLPLTTTDGPSGIRLKAVSSLLPVGVALACTFNTPLIEALYEEIGKEMAARGSDILLAPGMNIHRNPLCGRNFEYFSEDPVVTGKCGAAVVRGVQKYDFSACPKHFACNSQETARTKEDSVLSERALREIYLKGFMICVQSAEPKNLMTSYNKINGVWGHYNYELVTDILRKEWGFEGSVMTDWWMRSSSSPEFPSLKDQAYRVRAGVNILMPGGARAGRYSKVPDGTLLETLGKDGGITLAELQQNAKQIIAMTLK